MYKKQNRLTVNGTLLKVTILACTSLNLISLFTVLLVAYTQRAILIVRFNALVIDLVNIEEVLF